MSATGMISSEPGTFTGPGVVPLQVGLLRRQVQPPVGQLPDPLPVALDHQLGRDLVGGRVDQRAGVTGREEVHPGIVGEEQLGGVEAGRRGKRAPGGPGGVVGEVRRVAGVTGDRVVPARGPAIALSTSVRSRSVSGTGSCLER